MNRRPTLVALVATAVLFTAAAVAVAATAPHWTPRAMGKALRNPNVKLVGVVTDDFKPAVIYRRGVIVNAAACRGVGSHTRAGWALFQCHLRYAVHATGSTPETGTYWTVPWKKTIVCVSNVSRGTCPPPVPAHPLPGDPRNCSVTKSDPLNGPFSCLSGTAETAASKGQPVVNEMCVAGSKWTVYHCTWTVGSATVTFKQGKKRWTTIVTS